MAAALAPSPLRVLHAAGVGGRGWTPGSSAVNQLRMPRAWGRGCWPGMDTGQRFPASAAVGGLGDSVSLCLPRGSRPGLGKEEVLGLRGRVVQAF